MALVKDWKNAYKWFSTQAMAGAIALQATWMNLPPDLKSSVPDQLVTYGTLLLIILGLIGRLVDQGPKDPTSDA